jgi:hypothetical protein
MPPTTTHLKIFRPGQPYYRLSACYNFILHLHMDPGDKIYTIDEFRCWKVENLDDERSDENNNEGDCWS